MSSLQQEEVFEWNDDEELHPGNASKNNNDNIDNFREAYRAKVDPNDTQDGFITTTTVSPSDAFEVFQGNVFFTRNEYTYSDSIEQRVETPMQRFTRLRIELEELQSDLSSLAQVRSTRMMHAARYVVVDRLIRIVHLC